MVCSLGSGRMAVMARLLSPEIASQSMAEESSQQKLTGQDIYRELCEADEANLLDEEDMNVFGLMPMTDPLQLVCCKACKRPVKASQYTVHAELCRSLSLAGEVALEHDGIIRPKKPLRKERKKPLTTRINRTIAVVDQERHESTDVVAALESPFCLLSGKPSSFSVEDKKNSATVGVASMMDSKGVSPLNTDHPVSVVLPPTKRSKLTPYSHQLQPDGQETASGMKKNTATGDPYTCREFQTQSLSGSGMPNDFVASKCTQPSREGLQLINGIPVPLATKVYYSQRNNRLRATISRMYHTPSAKPLHHVMSPELSQEILTQLQAPPHSGISREVVAGLHKKKGEADLVLAESSEPCLDKSGGSMPLANSSNQSPDDGNIISVSVVPVQSKYLTEPYSFSSNSARRAEFSTNGTSDSALEELVYTFGGPWLFGLILLGLLILLSLVLSVARMKYAAGDELPAVVPPQGGSRIDRSFPFLESLNEVLETNRTEESQLHVHRMYFMRPNTFSEPWHLSHSPPEQVMEIV